MKPLAPAPFSGFDTETLLTAEPARLALKLRRLKGSRPRAPAVLLLHGGNSSSLTYTAPNGGLARFLGDAGCDVWLLDWRSSPFVVEPLLARSAIAGSAASERKYMNLDLAADEDLPLALAKIRSAIGADTPLSVMGHCLGSAMLAMSVARGNLERFDLAAVVLSTFGLFCEVPWNGWLKAEDFILERTLHDNSDCRAIDPKDRAGWPEALTKAYAGWPKAWLPKASEFLRSLTFMIGRPYTPERVAPEFRGDDVEKYFGPMHLGLYLHAGQIVRRGFCARLDAPDVVDRSRLRVLSPCQQVPSDLHAEHFAGKRMVLIAAAENHIWHRDSIDLMYEWLLNHGCSNTVKHVLPGYNLQELLWGIRADVDVYPLIASAVLEAHRVAPRAAE